MGLGKIEKKTAEADWVPPEKYVLMNEREKDVEIEKAVARLQKRIQEILYTIELKRHGH